MVKEALDSEKFHYVYRKDLGYYTVNIDEPYWDRQKKQMRHRYKMVGKSSIKGGPIEFGPSYRAIRAQRGYIDALSASTTIYEGELLLLQHIAQELGLGRILTKVLGKEDAKKVLALASYVVCTHEPLSYAAPWLEARGLGHLGLEAPRISELLPTFTADRQNSFFSLWLKEKASSEALCYDITSVSSYARDNDLIEYGYNRDHEHLRQINLALVSNKHTSLPLWYAPLPGSLNDTKTLKKLVLEMKKLDVGSFSLIMDRGFYSKENLEFLVRAAIKFMIPIPSTVEWQKRLILENRATMFTNVEGYIPTEEGTMLQSLTVYKPFEDGERAWLHIYYDSTIRSHAEQEFMAYYKQCFDEFSSGELDPTHQDFYNEYFRKGYKTKNGQKVIPKKDPVEVFREDTAGYWCLYTTSEKDAKTALEVYRERSEIEQLFDDLKNSLDCNRLRVHTKAGMQGRLFIQFIALILLSELKRHIREQHELLAKYGNHKAILMRVASFSSIRFQGKYKELYSAPTKAQEIIFDTFGVEYPKNE